MTLRRATLRRATLREALARIRYGLVSLLSECAIAVTVLTALIVAAPLTVIVAAQLHALATTGQWRGFPVSELLDVLQVDPEALPTRSDSVAGFALSLPASLVLLTATLALCVLAVFLHRTNRRMRARLQNVLQSALIKDIERQLDHRRSG
jgi:hypothetical protein